MFPCSFLTLLMWAFFISFGYLDQGSVNLAYLLKEPAVGFIDITGGVPWKVYLASAPSHASVSLLTGCHETSSSTGPHTSHMPPPPPNYGPETTELCSKSLWNHKPKICPSSLLCPRDLSQQCHLQVRIQSWTQVFQVRAAGSHRTLYTDTILP